MNRYLAACYGALSYLTFLAALGYAIGFVSNIAVPRSIDHGIAAPVGQAVVVDGLLLGLFAVQHSVMARPAFKRWWIKFVPEAIERSTYVLLASETLFVLYSQWRTMPAVIWDIASPTARLGLWSLFWLGWIIVVSATFMIDHSELFGLRQVHLVWRRESRRDTEFRTILLYRLVRHPLMLGFIVAFWATPTMTAGHLFFAIVTTAYILIAIQFEEHDLTSALGDQYRKYRRDVPMLIPRAHHRVPQRQAESGADSRLLRLLGG